MNSQDFELVPVASGAYSLRLLPHRETFHPEIGPMAEARLLHVEQQELKQRALQEPSLVIWDVGLGAAANAIAAIEELISLPSEITLHSFDISLSSLRFALEHAEALTYLMPYREVLQTLMREAVVELRPGLRWYLHEGDFRTTMHTPGLEAPHAIFYDPYSAKTNPEIWSLEHFRALKARLDPDHCCRLTNYTRSTAIRATLLSAGFYVGQGVALGSKEESTIASNVLTALAKPLGLSWLARLQASQNARLLRAGDVGYGSIDPLDLAALVEHPQFTAGLQHMSASLSWFHSR